MFSTIFPYAVGFSKYKPGYNDIGLCDTAFTTSDILWYQINSSLSTMTVHFSVITTLVYNDTKYSVPFITL